MKEQFIPYHLALQLKQLGFNQSCIGYYNQQTEELFPYQTTTSTNGHKCAAPLWQQAFDWFDEKGIEGVIYSTASGYHWSISKSAFNPESNISGGTSICDLQSNGPNMAGRFNTKKEAEEDCLNKLIETHSNQS